MAATAFACSTERPERRNDTVQPKATPPAEPHTTGGTLAAVWDTAAGSFFAVPGAMPAQANLIYPAYIFDQHLDTLHIDSAAVINLGLDLLSDTDSVRQVRIASVLADTAEECSGWPSATLVQADHLPVTQPWQVAFPRGRVVTVPFDSLPGLATSDSSRLTIAVTRAASRIAGDTAAAFRGRPYVVRQANRFRNDDGRYVVLAEVVRVVTQEANPLQEQLLLVLEEQSGKPGSLTVAYSERRIGLEENLESVDLTSVLRFRSGTWALLVRREVGDGARFVLFERRSPDRWILRWRSAYAGC
jgi:hypothetical protein